MAARRALGRIQGEHGSHIDGKAGLKGLRDLQAPGRREETIVGGGSGAKFACEVRQGRAAHVRDHPVHKKRADRAGLRARRLARLLLRFA